VSRNSKNLLLLEFGRSSIEEFLVLWLMFPIIAFFSFGLTWLISRYALARGVIDLPNLRSSHTAPTPRGGGVAIVFSFSAASLTLFYFNMLPSAQIAALLGAGVFVAINGFWDDHVHIAVRWRLLGHFLASFWVLYWVDGLAPLSFFSWVIELGAFGYLISAIFLVYMLNLYNFMDGIDGIAAIEAVSVCASAAFLYWVKGEETQVYGPLLLACSVLGFLYWNYPPAKIFMGDAGSGFLGIIFGIFVLQAAWIASDFFFAWLILLGVFIVDATLTLVRRFLRGEKIYEAHRSHAYQSASRYYGRHLPVTLATGILNVCWLLPIAFLVVDERLEGVIGLLIAYLPLLFLAFRFRAGAMEAS
jgi:Fuc2NAc and GlcNAc transferase